MIFEDKIIEDDTRRETRRLYITNRF